MKNLVRKYAKSTTLVRTKPSIRRGFTLVQLVVSLGIMSMLATMMFSVFSDGRATARRTQCDVQLKTIALALDAFRQENRFYPATLQELKDKHYLHDESALHCPMDMREDGTYGDFYAIRSPRDPGDLPMLVCPFHENQGNAGAQVFKDRYTRQFLTRPAKLEQATGALIERAGQSPVTAVAGLVLHGGDRIRTTASGAALIRFADTSSCELSGNADLTVLQSFVATNKGSTLYTMVRQSLGTVIHRVNHGSKFDVATPTATAGALGTVFKITINPNGTGTLTVIASQVYVSTLRSQVVIPTGGQAAMTAGDASRATPSLNPNDNAIRPTPTPTAIPTPTPTTIPTPTPTANPCSGPGNSTGDHNHGHDGDC